MKAVALGESRLMVRRSLDHAADPVARRQFEQWQFAA